MVMIEIVPSSFFREATVLFHSPTSNGDGFPVLRDLDFAQRRIGERPASFWTAADRPGTTSRSRSLAIAAFTLRGSDLELLVRFGLAVERAPRAASEQRPTNDHA
jgi:hypothetical protein